MGKGDVKDAAQ